MWYRLMVGAAVGSCVWLVLERIEADRLIAGWHRAGDNDDALSRIGDVLAAEYARSGIESKCCLTRGVAHVITTRRAHARIAAALRDQRRPRTPATSTSANHPA